MLFSVGGFFCEEVDNVTRNIFKKTTGFLHPEYEIEAGKPYTEKSCYNAIQHEKLIQKHG